jgi:SAM-dependent methyltransferase
MTVRKISGKTIRADLNRASVVRYYSSAAVEVGLWKSELRWIRRHLPDRRMTLLEAGCGAGRVARGLWREGYHNLVGFDFSESLVTKAAALVAAEGMTGVSVVWADATALHRTRALRPGTFDGVLFLFNGLMQIPGRQHRRAAMRGLLRVARPGARMLFTTHDRDERKERSSWAREAKRWRKGMQRPQLLEFGDRYFKDVIGSTFIHVPARSEILEDLAATGWTHIGNATRDQLAREGRKVRGFSDNCRFWAAGKPLRGGRRRPPHPRREG